MPNIEELGDGAGPVKREREEIKEVNNQVRERTVSSPSNQSFWKKLFGKKCFDGK